MRSDADFKALLNAIEDPVMIVDRDGLIHDLNASAMRLLDLEAHKSHDVSKLLSYPEPDEFRQYLRRCSGRSAPTLGALAFSDKTRRYECWGSRLSSVGGKPEIILRLSPVDQNEFSVLATKVKELNGEVRRRRLSQAKLEEALSYNQVLLRELHHRAKNNIQVMIGFFATAKREAVSPELTTFLDTAIQRLIAMGTTQELMHESPEMHQLPADEFVTRIVQTAAEGLGSHVRAKSLACKGRFIPTEVAQPLALIINELLTNSAKHGKRDGFVNINVDMNDKEGEIILVMQDDGPGFPDMISASTVGSSRRSSGLNLVRGLCRQIGASLHIENVNGARIIVKIPHQPSKGIHH